MTTVVMTLLDQDNTPATQRRACPECFGWGFLWAEQTEGEPMPGPDCLPCHGTGMPW